MCRASLMLISSYRASSPTSSFFFFFNDTATTEIYTLSLHDALPICPLPLPSGRSRGRKKHVRPPGACASTRRSEEHTSELQSHLNLVCRLLLEKKKNTKSSTNHRTATTSMRARTKALPDASVVPECI